MKKILVVAMLSIVMAASGCSSCGSRPHLFGWWHNHDQQCGGGCGNGGCGSNYGGFSGGPCDGQMMMGTPVPSGVQPNVRIIPGETIPSR